MGLVKLILMWRPKLPNRGLLNPRNENNAIRQFQNKLRNSNEWRNGGCIVELLIWRILV